MRTVNLTDRHTAHVIMQHAERTDDGHRSICFHVIVTDDNAAGRAVVEVCRFAPGTPILARRYHDSGLQSLIELGPLRRGDNALRADVADADPLTVALWALDA